MSGIPFSYPKNVAYGLSHLAGYHRNTFKIETVSATSVGAGRVIRVNLPENAIIDLKSFRWVVNQAICGAASTTYRNVFPFAQGLINRLEVSVNGMALTPGFNEYNTAYRIIRNARVPTSKSLTVDAALQNQTLDTTLNPTTQQQIQFIVQDWIGFFGDPSTRFIDTGKTGVISVAITLADDAVCGSTTAGTISTLPGGANYTLDKFYFTIDCISMADGMYDELLSRMIARDGYIPLSWNEYISFQQDGLSGSSAQVRFAISSQSVNKIYGTLRTGGASGYTAKNTTSPAASFWDTIVVPTSATGLVEAYQPNYFKFQSFGPALGTSTAATAPMQWGYTINNAPHPAYGYCSLIEGLSQLAICENKVFLDSPGNQISSLGDYNANKFVAAIRLNHPIDGETKNKYISGYDTRGVNSQIVWNLQNLSTAPASYSAFILVETTSTLKIGSGRQLELIM